MTAPPAIILSHTQMGENIGAAARAMKNFGLSDLVLIAPRCAWPNDRAQILASGSGDILERARVCATAAEAVSAQSAQVLMISADHGLRPLVSRTRCITLRGAPQIRDPSFCREMDPGSIAHRFTLRGIRSTKEARHESPPDCIARDDALLPSLA